jgi:excisionase family DNA binding protein
MADKDESLKLTARDVANAFADPTWGARFPPVLTVDQTAELLQIPKQTVYDWHSRGLLKGCCRRVGKHLRFFRDRLLNRIFNEGLHPHGT